jgi:CBS domain-containing protein
MQLHGDAIRITIYIGEGDRFQGGSLYTAILEKLRREGASGATVTRALAGFGAQSRIHTSNIEVLSTDLPIRIEWIDRAPRVERLLPQIQQMVQDGLIVEEPIKIVQAAVGSNRNPLDLAISRIMRDQVTTTPPDSSVAEVVGLLLERGVRSLPVVDKSRRLLGILTDGDLLHRAGLATRIGLHNGLPDDQASALLAALRESPLTAGEIMTTPVIAIRGDETVRTAVARMVKHDLKRLPVVGEEGKLIGMVTRIDIFRTVEQHQGSDFDDEAPRSGSSVEALMYVDAPTVGPDASLESIVQALEASQRRRVVVLDADRRVLGIITDGDLLRRSQQKHDPGLLARIRTLLVGEPPINQVLPDADECASDLMTTPVVTVNIDTPLAAALHLMAGHAIKRLPVVDSEGRFVGLLGRASLLRGLLE